MFYERLRALFGGFMVYIAPSYGDLLKATDLLPVTYTQLSARYVPPDYKTLTEAITSMERRYGELVLLKAKASRFFTPRLEPLRLDQISYIVKLEKILPEPLTSAEVNATQKVLLGALFYRRISIKSSYDGIMCWMSGWNPSCSALYRTIDELLGITGSNALDDLSVETCCKAYYEHIMRLPETIRLTYFDASEQVKLTEMIAVFEEKARPIHEDMRPLFAIGALRQLLDGMHSEMRVQLTVFDAFLTAEKLPEVETLSREAIIASLDTRNPTPRIRAMFDYLLPSDMSLNRLNSAGFLADMQERLAVYSQYVLLGAYIVALGKAPSMEVRNTLYRAIGGLLPGNALDDEARVLALTALDHYLSLPGISDKDFSAFGSYDMLQRDVTLQLADLGPLSSVAM